MDGHIADANLNQGQAGSANRPVTAKTALFAQRFVRHKIHEERFSGVLWTTVILNVAGFVPLYSLVGQSLCAAILT